MSRETGIPKKDIRNYGRYSYFDNKEMIELGGHTIVAANGKVKIWDPVYHDDDAEVSYRSREVKI